MSCGRYRAQSYCGVVQHWLLWTFSVARPKWSLPPRWVGPSGVTVGDRRMRVDFCACQLNVDSEAVLESHLPYGSVSNADFKTAMRRPTCANVACHTLRKLEGCSIPKLPLKSALVRASLEGRTLLRLKTAPKHEPKVPDVKGSARSALARRSACHANCLKLAQSEHLSFPPSPNLKLSSESPGGVPLTEAGSRTRVATGKVERGGVHSCARLARA